MIDLETALEIHDRSIDNYGGSRGIRDKGSLLAALARPYATFDQQELYPTPVEKAAAIFESLIINHPFMDGNKRTAYVLLRATLYIFGFDISASQIEKHEMTIAASKGDIRIDEIKVWIEEHLVTINQ
ncbi:type II toxin-antitoxin system death-on-curing family toxin [Mucilaginibacter sp. X5P1]|uniref:type II toxin-antitoxin system death-on-curing family toxin n=1 Tax=Mucilaginibacter sp. X5P1 TaxID=2723088 RepID=UPI001616175C|nr:type II toxin-antitoxin system death-on-curing family toxin [Mucilaginibacter sp. X5P1]MBB6138180.1 death-on-curing protein [Mucilaginibacter sp. X5P1]